MRLLRHNLKAGCTNWFFQVLFHYISGHIDLEALSQSKWPDFTVRTAAWLAPMIVKKSQNYLLVFSTASQCSVIQGFMMTEPLLCHCNISPPIYCRMSAEARNSLTRSDVVTRSRHRKRHVRLTTFMHAILEKLWEAVFSVGPYRGHIWRIETQAPRAVRQ
jgi:hypothetical protein